MGITTREFGPNAKGSRLTTAEMDENFNYLNSKPYKVYTALLTQSGGDDEQFMADDIYLVKGVTYNIVANDVPNFNFVPYGAPNNNNGTNFVANETITFLGITDCSLSYNTGAPVVTVLENTIGNVWFTYDGVGSYFANSDGLFIEGKTTVFIGPLNNSATEGYSMLGFQSNSNIQEVRTLAAPAIYSNDLLTYTPIEIRVYN